MILHALGLHLAMHREGAPETKVYKNVYTYIQIWEPGNTVAKPPGNSTEWDKCRRRVMNTYIKSHWLGGGGMWAVMLTVVAAVE